MTARHAVDAQANRAARRRLARGEADRFDRFGERAGRGRVRIEFHLGALALERDIDARDARLSLEGARDRRRAVTARHTVDEQFDLHLDVRTARAAKSTLTTS